MLDTPKPASPNCLAATLTDYGDKDVVKIAVVNRPLPGPSQVLVRTEAAGVNNFDHELRKGHLTDYFPAQFPHVMGLELAGVVVEAGRDVKRLKVGDRVMGELRAKQGAFSQYVAVDEDNLCLTPDNLSALQAAAIPSVALTAWGGLRALVEPTAGMTILVHGASGNVGSYVVQFAAAAGAKVYATASARNVEYVRDLGAARVFERETEHPADSLSSVDLIIDMVGGKSVDRLWGILAPDGALVSIADPEIEKRAPEGVKTCWYKMVFDYDRLRQIADDVAAGRIKSTIGKVVPMVDLPDAIEEVGTGQSRETRGKIVIAVH